MKSSLQTQCKLMAIKNNFASIDYSFAIEKAPVHLQLVRVLSFLCVVAAIFMPLYASFGLVDLSHTAAGPIAIGATVAAPLLYLISIPGFVKTLCSSTYIAVTRPTSQHWYTSLTEHYQGLEPLIGECRSHCKQVIIKFRDLGSPSLSEAALSDKRDDIIVSYRDCLARLHEVQNTLSVLSHIAGQISVKQLDKSQKKNVIQLSAEIALLTKSAQDIRSELLKSLNDEQVASLQAQTDEAVEKALSSIAHNSTALELDTLEGTFLRLEQKESSLA